MKKLSVALIVCCMPLVSDAGIEIPRGVYKADQISEAGAEARKENKGLAFVMTDPGTTCGLCVAASDMAFQKLKSHSVIVFIPSKDEARWSHVSPLVVTGFSEKKMGNIIPKAVITSPDMTELWAQMSYEDLKKDDQYRGVKKQVDAILKGEAKPENPPDRFIYWPINGSSSFYIGRFQGLNDKGALQLIMQKDGKPATIPLERLTGHCAALARKLAGRESAANPASAANEPAFETWTGSNGKTLQARFISLVDDKVTLEMEGGKNHTLPMERLAEPSRERARELQAKAKPSGSASL